MEEKNEMEIQQDLEPDEPGEGTPRPESKPAAFTLVIQSWTTPIVGIIMLVAGLFGGYYGRLLLSPETSSVTVVGNPSTDTGSSVPITAPTPDKERAAQQQGLMSAVIEGTRHFRGDPDAPVTIIEFSDFQ